MFVSSSAYTKWSIQGCKCIMGNICQWVIQFHHPRYHLYHNVLLILISSEVFSPIHVYSNTWMYSVPNNLQPFSLYMIYCSRFKSYLGFWFCKIAYPIRRSTIYTPVYGDILVVLLRITWFSCWTSLPHFRLYYTFYLYYDHFIWIQILLTTIDIIYDMVSRHQNIWIHITHYT